jgi:hypothetical protein
MPWPLYRREKGSRYTLVRRLGGRQSWPGCYGEMKILDVKVRKCLSGGEMLMTGFCKPGNKFTGRNMTCIHIIFETLGFTGFLQYQKVDDLKKHRANYT